MSKIEILQDIELALSNVWGGKVHLADSEQIEGHQQIFRLVVQTVLPDLSGAVILKHCRWEEQYSLCGFLYW